MKEKIKTSLVSIGIFYMIIILILMISKYTNMNKYINITFDNNYQETISKYEKEILTIEEKSCQNVLNDYLNYVKKTTFKGKVNLQEYFKNFYLTDSIFLDYYLKLIDNCSKLTKENAVENNLNNMMLTAYIQNEEILQKYIFNYELTIKDNLFRITLEPEFVATKSKIKFNNEIGVLNIVLNIMKDGDENEN